MMQFLSALWNSWSEHSDSEKPKIYSNRPKVSNLHQHKHACTSGVKNIYSYCTHANFVWYWVLCQWFAKLTHMFCLATVFSISFTSVAEWLWLIAVPAYDVGVLRSRKTMIWFFRFTKSLAALQNKNRQYWEAHFGEGRAAYQTTLRGRSNRKSA